MKKKQTLRRCAAALTAAVLGAVSVPVIAVSSESYNTWTGYMLQDSTGRYLSVLGGTEGRVYRSAFMRQTVQHPTTRGISRKPTWALRSNPHCPKANTI